MNVKSAILGAGSVSAVLLFGGILGVLVFQQQLDRSRLAILETQHATLMADLNQKVLPEIKRQLDLLTGDAAKPKPK